MLDCLWREGGRICFWGWSWRWGWTQWRGTGLWGLVLVLPWLGEEGEPYSTQTIRDSDLWSDLASQLIRVPGSPNSRGKICGTVLASYPDRVPGLLYPRGQICGQIIGTDENLDWVKGRWILLTWVRVGVGADPRGWKIFPSVQYETPEP